MAMAYQMNLLLAALTGGLPCPDPDPDSLVPAPRGPWGSAGCAASRTTRYAAPSGMTRTSSSTAMIKEPRVHLTTSSFKFKTETCPMVGWSVAGRMTAEATCKANAFELEVENAAEPAARAAAGVASSIESVATLALERSRRAAPART